MTTVDLAMIAKVGRDSFGAFSRAVWSAEAVCDGAAVVLDSRSAATTAPALRSTADAPNRRSRRHSLVSARNRWPR